MNAMTYDPATLMQQHQRQVGGLRFTEWMLLVALAWAYLFSISMPLFGTQLQISAIKHFPLMLLVPALALHFAGVLLNRDRGNAAGVLGVTWSMVVMALFVITGSLVARQELNVKETFLTFGLYLLLLPLCAAIPTRTEHAARWVKAIAALWIVAGLAALTGEIVRFTQEGLLHEIEYMVISAFFVLFYLARGPWLKALAIVLMLVAAGVNQKLTGYILVAAALLYMFVDWGWRRADRKWRGFYVLIACTLVVAAVLGLALGYFEFRSVLPTGNPEVRMKQYDEALRRFIESPIWGSAYLDGSGEVFVENRRALNIPTHSDVLDMLKHGGLIGFGLFAWGYWKIFRVISRAAVATQGDHLMHAYFVSARFFQLSALVTFSINPLLLKGPFLIVIWANLGLAVGLALMALRPQAAKPPAG